MAVVSEPSGAYSVLAARVPSCCEKFKMLLKTDERASSHGAGKRRAPTLSALLVALATGCSGVIEEAQGADWWVAGPGSADAEPASPPPLGTADPALLAAAMRFFPNQASASPKGRLFRLTLTQMQRTAEVLLPGVEVPAVAQEVPRDPLQTNYEYSDILRFNDANFTPYVTWVRGLAERVEEHPNAVIPCAQEDTGCLAARADAFVRGAFRGVVTDGQLASYRNHYLAAVGEVGMARASAELVDLALTSPSFVFREEVFTGPGERLLPAQLLQHLTYALADSPPQALGLDPAQADMLVGDPLSYQRTVEAVLASSQARDKLQRFFLAWLEVKEPEDFTISTEAFPEFTPAVAAAVVDEARRFLQVQLAVAEPTLRGITQVTHGFVSAQTAELYGLSRRTLFQATLDEPVSLDPSQRLGVFTMPAVLASHSGPTTTRLVKRGVFFVRKVMCMPLGAPPQGLDTSVPSDAGDTERERIENATAQPACAGCHGFINPFGFMLEEFDAVGRYRTTEAGHPINARIDVDFLEDGPFSADGAVEGLSRFTESARFEQCFSRQVFRFYLGRDEVPGDDPVLREMYFRFADHDRQDIVAMLRSLAMSSAFTARTEVR